MKLLLDTQIAVWAVTANSRLGARALEVLKADDAHAHVSAVSLWEIGIKYALGPNRADPMPFGGRRARTLFDNARFTPVTMTADHALAVEMLPPLHGDPFDRMLVAQARAEGMTLLTRDARLAGYGGFVMVV